MFIKFNRNVPTQRVVEYARTNPPNGSIHRRCVYDAKWRHIVLICTNRLSFAQRAPHITLDILRPIHLNEQPTYQLHSHMKHFGEDVQHHQHMNNNNKEFQSHSVKLNSSA